MGYVRNIANQQNQQTFPGATFQIAGDVPAAQCSEARIEGNTATTTFPPRSLTDANKFIGWALGGKQCTITSNPNGNTGTFDITGNTDDQLFLAQNPGVGGLTEYYVHNGGSLILTRNIQSFAAYIDAFESTYSGHQGVTPGGSPLLNITGPIPLGLAGNTLQIIIAAPPNQGNYLITDNTPSRFSVTPNIPIAGGGIAWRVNTPSPYATTIKNGELFTDIPAADLQTACSIIFDPID